MNPLVNLASAWKIDGLENDAEDDDLYPLRLLQEHAGRAHAEIGLAGCNVHHRIATQRSVVLP